MFRKDVGAILPRVWDTAKLTTVVELSSSGDTPVVNDEGFDLSPFPLIVIAQEGSSSFGFPSEVSKIMSLIRWLKNSELIPEHYYIYF